MKNLLIYLFLFCSVALVAQEREHIKTHEMGDEAARTKINTDFDLSDAADLEIDTLQAADTTLQANIDTLGMRVDSSKAVFNWVDSTATVIVITGDSGAFGAITYTDTYWDDLRVPLTNTRINPANSEPDFEDCGDGTFAWGFDAGNDSTFVLNFITQTPHERLDSSDLDAHIHWQPEDTNTGGVVWKMIYTVAAINGEFTATDTFRVVDPGDGTALKHQLIDLGDIDGSNLGISAIIKGSIGRMGDAADDTYTGTAYGLEIDFHYQIDRPGSEEEYIKY